MEWYNYLAIFFAGAFLANAVPHFVHGVSGDKFPSPFSKPPGQGLSSPVINVLWGLFNLIVGFILTRSGKLQASEAIAMTIFFAGAIAMSLMLSINFQKKDKE